MTAVDAAEIAANVRTAIATLADRQAATATFTDREIRINRWMLGAAEVRHNATTVTVYFPRGDATAADFLATALLDAARALSLSDLRDPENVTADDSPLTSWQVGCYFGHVLVLPQDVGCPEGCDDTPCEHGEFDHAEDSRTFRAHDMARLRDVLAAFEVMAR